MPQIRDNLLKKYLKKVKDHLKTRIGIKKLENLLKKYRIQFNQIDMENIEYILHNRDIFDRKLSTYPKDFTPPIKEQDVVDVILDFYDFLNPDLGKRMRNLYENNKDRILIYNYESEATRGLNNPIFKFIDKFNPDLGKKMRNLYIKYIGYKTITDAGVSSDPRNGNHTFPDGKQGICRINFVNNYLLYFTVAHEFMHLLIFNLDKNNEQLSEVHPRFIEHILADYLVKKGIITKEDRLSHLNAINNAYGNADVLMTLKDLYDILDNHKGKISLKNLLNLCAGYTDRMNHMITDFIRILDGPGVNKPKNKLRFVNSAVDTYKLYELYKQNPDEIMEKYRKILTQNEVFHKNDYESFLREMEAEDIKKDSKSKKRNLVLIEKSEILIS